MFWTKKEIDYLIKNYPLIGKVASAKKLGRTIGSIRTKAYRLKLGLNYNSEFCKEWQNRARISKIGKKRLGHSKFMKKYIKNHPEWTEWSDERRKQDSITTKGYIKKHGHPRGMLGKKQTDKQKKIVSKSSKLMWADPNSKVNSKKHRQELSDRTSKMMINRIKNKGTIYSRCNNGWYKIKNKKHYFRSSWEVVYARYLEFLKDKKEIKKWEYESDTFWFEKIKRGVRSYTPDFKVFNNDGTIEYHEVKGYMDAKSKTKLKRMTKYYPEIKMVLIDKSVYKEIFKFERLYPKATKIEKDKKN